MRMLFASISAPLIEYPISPNEEQFNLNIESFNKDYAKAVILNGKKIGHYNNYDILEASTNLYATAVNVIITDGRIVYLCQWTRETFSGMEAIVQLNVWQDPNPEYKGLARSLLDWVVTRKHLVILSDTQYPKGALMYQKYIKENVGRRFIYIKNNNNIVRIFSAEQFNLLIDKIWSKNQSHKNVRVIISTKPLELH